MAAKKTEEQMAIAAQAPKAAAKKTSAKKAEPKTNVVVEFYGRQIITKDVVAACEAAYKAENKEAVKSIDVYVKPEDNAAYYVVNATVSGKIDL